MLFNSIAFLLFFPLVCLLYYSIPSRMLKGRNMLLLVASYYFYMNWKPAYALLLLVATSVTYLSALGMCHFKGKRRRRAFLIGSIILNLALLLLFKYYAFLAENIKAVLEWSGIALQMPEFGLLLPVGISFYIFQALGYSIDVYKGKTKAELDFPTYALFVSFFPQLVAGPIERSNNLLPQFHEEHHIDYERVMAGLRMMLWGYFMKLVLADRCGLYVDAVFNNVDKHNGGAYLLASFLFPFQIYGDFAGYSLIAIGAAKIMGFHLMENFHRPYFSCSVSEFWHRWHISLSTWFKDYVYISLGGNRVSRIRQYFNLMVTFLLSGIWHGANWTFVCWGGLHGILLCIEKGLGFGRNEYYGLNRLTHWVITFVVVCLAWILFRSNSIADGMLVFSGLFTKMNIPDISFSMFTEITQALMALLVLFCKELGLFSKFLTLNSSSWLFSTVVSHLYMVSIIVFILLFGVLDGDQFIYFQF